MTAVVLAISNGNFSSTSSLNRMVGLNPDHHKTETLVVLEANEGAELLAGTIHALGAGVLVASALHLTRTR